MHETIAASLVDCDIGANLREMDGRLNPVIKGMANVDRWSIRKTNQCLSAGNGMMRVYDIGSFTKSAQIVSLGTGDAKVAFSTDHERDGAAIDLARIELRPDEGIVLVPA